MTAVALVEQVERLVPCQFSAYQQALCRLVEGEVAASEEGTASKALKKINNTLMELRTISNHPLIRCLPLAPNTCDQSCLLCAYTRQNIIPHLMFSTVMVMAGRATFLGTIAMTSFASIATARQHAACWDGSPYPQVACMGSAGTFC